MLAAFGEWIEKEHRTVLPKSPLGQAVGYARNQWASLDRYLTDARFTIDNNVAERAVRPLAVGRKNWLFIGGYAGLPTASVLLSLCASAKRHGLNPWVYLTEVLTQMSAKHTDLSPLLPDDWGKQNRLPTAPGKPRYFTGCLQFNRVWKGWTRRAERIEAMNFFEAIAPFPTQ